MCRRPYKHLTCLRPQFASFKSRCWTASVRIPFGRPLLPSWLKQGKIQVRDLFGKKHIIIDGICMIYVVTSSHFKILQATAIYSWFFSQLQFMSLRWPQGPPMYGHHPDRPRRQGTHDSYCWFERNSSKTYKLILATIALLFTDWFQKKKSPVLRTCFSSFLSKDRGHRVITGHS